MADRMLVGGGQSRTPVTQIVRVRTGQNDRIAAGACERNKAVVELALAVVAPVATVRGVAGACEFVCLDDFVPNSDRARYLPRAGELPRRQSRRNGRDRDRSASERAGSERRDDR